MWQVRCSLGAGHVGKVVTRSLFTAVMQYLVWRMNGRPATLGRYTGERHKLREEAR